MQLSVPVQEIIADYAPAGARMFTPIRAGDVSSCSLEEADLLYIQSAPDMAELRRIILDVFRYRRLPVLLCLESGFAGAETLVRELAATVCCAVRTLSAATPVHTIARLDPDRPRTYPPKAVTIVSCGNVGNFGDRLGFHVINRLLPPEACVTHHMLPPWNLPAAGGDLLILGLGNSLFGPLLQPELLDVIGRFERRIGIFGTQYRSQISGDLMARVLDSLDVWYARSEEDLYLFGRGRHNTVHLGDWLLTEFPMADWRQDEVLHVGPEVWHNYPLDRTIQQIRLYARVFSTRLHPLLGALASAREVAYREQREDGSGEPSGKFRSMLIDVFGRTFSEETFFAVDRRAVAAYKRLIHNNVFSLGETLARLLSAS